MGPNNTLPAPVVVETKNYGHDEQRSQGSSARELTRKFMILGGLFIALIACVCVFGYLLFIFTDEVWGREGVKHLARVIGWGSGILMVAGAIYAMQYATMAQLTRVHWQTIAGIVHHQKWDDMGEIARTRANDDARVLPSVIRAMSEAQTNARQIAQETHRHARFLSDKERVTSDSDTQAFLAKLASMPTDGVIDLA